MNIAQILRTAILKNIYEWLLLKQSDLPVPLSDPNVFKF